MRPTLACIIFLSIALLAVSCNPDSTTGEENIQREETIRTDDLREKDSFNRNVPVDKKEIDENEEELEIGPDSPIND